MAKLQDFIPERATELEKLLEPLRRQYQEIEEKIRAYEKELSELQSAAKAIGIVNRLQRPLGVTRKVSPPQTIKEAVLDVLRDYPEGLIALDILAKINERFSTNLVRTSLSPQLSRLKQYDHKIEYDAGVWRLITPKNEGSAA
jgi:predicted nuclease with TOPRIM domain